jgi:hypothetical protein
MLQHGYINPPSRSSGAQLVAVNPEGFVQTEDMSAVGDLGSATVVSANLTLGVGATDNVVLVMGSTTSYDAIIAVRTNALAEVELYEWYGPYVGGIPIPAQAAVDRTDAAALEAVDYVALASTTGGTGQTLLYEDIDSMVGCVMGVGAALNSMALRWRLSLGVVYAIEVTDLGGAGGFANVTAIMYALEA